MTQPQTIRILPDGRQIEAQNSGSFMEALIDASIFLRSDCGGRGHCGKCRINKITMTGERESFTSCNTRVTEDVTIEIPESSMLSSHIITKAPVSLPSSFINKKRNTHANESYSIAVDLGTTTIAVYLCNSRKGTVLSSIAVKNPQSLYGDDVMNRIGAIIGKTDNLARMQKMVIRAIEWGVARLLAPRSLTKDRIMQIVVVGNPTMIHILSGVDPRPIGLSPYLPAYYEARTIDSVTVGFDMKNIPLVTLPQISGFIGGDILSAAIATDLESQPDGTLLIDLGTNGELLFKAGGRLFATSCATGPAFEGASLSCGIQAVPGAINKVVIADRHNFPKHTTIHSRTKRDPVGICGTGVISGIAELWRKKLITPDGAFITDSSIKPLRKDSENLPRYILVEADDTEDISAIYISQKDVRSVQLGKAALITGIEFLSKTAGYSQPEKIIIAGAFGSYMDKADMITIGMLPGIDPEMIEVAGNSAGAGAVMVACEKDYFTKSIELAKKITTIELATDINFQEVFINKLSFSS